MKNIIFDLYGTLIDIHTDEEKASFWAKLAKKTRKYKAYSPDELKNKYLAICSEKQKHIEELDVVLVFEELYEVDICIAMRIAKLFRRLSTEYIRLYKGVKKLLKKLKQQGYRLYVLSNAQESFTMPELEKLGIKRYFNSIAISSVYGVKKPNTLFYQQAIEKFGIDDGIMIGNDFECDIKPARELGLKTIFIESNLTFGIYSEPDFKGFIYERIYQKIIQFS